MPQHTVLYPIAKIARKAADRAKASAQKGERR